MVKLLWSVIVAACIAKLTFMETCSQCGNDCSQTMGHSVRGPRRCNIIHVTLLIIKHACMLP